MAPKSKSVPSATSDRGKSELVKKPKVKRTYVTEKGQFLAIIDKVNTNLDAIHDHKLAEEKSKRDMYEEMARLRSERQQKKDHRKEERVKQIKDDLKAKGEKKGSTGGKQKGKPKDGKKRDVGNGTAPKKEEPKKKRVTFKE